MPNISVKKIYKTSMTRYGTRSLWKEQLYIEYLEASDEEAISDNENHKCQ